MGSFTWGVIFSTAVAFMISPSANPELVNSDAARKRTVGTDTIQDEAAGIQVNFEQNPILFTV
jgi:hypothetical protein